MTDKPIRFITGVNRCKEAIKNAINELDEEQLAALKKDTQRLRDMMHTESHRDDADRHQSISLKQTTTVKKSGSKSVLNKRGGVYRSNNSVHNSTSGLVTDRDQMEKNLLEEIYPDRMFLKELMNDPIMMSASDGEVGSLIRDGFVFLDQRIEFWQSRNPLAVHEVTHLA